MFLNGGELDGTRFLSEESVDMMTRNQIGELVVERLPGIIPDMARSFPIGGGRDKFGLCFQIQGNLHRFRKGFTSVKRA